ncbi:AF1514 family protein [Thiobacter aerophilum]|uniref:AF1514 family protein n=1 Tax=Thiobacter aerophilum TaxID=3121275 RepID=A0ABV0EFN2_9BURK
MTDAPACPLRTPPDLTSVEVVSLTGAADYRVALARANAEAARRLAEPMLLSWYDRDRDFEAPQHISECHQDSAVPGYVDYALARGARLKIDFDHGRFVFFYRDAA